MSAHHTSINLKELSFLTGFSISTVSKALNNKLDVSTETKQLIMGVAKKHNYIPNSFGLGLRSKKSRTVAIILPQINTNFYSNLLFYFQQIADHHGYRIVVFQSFESETKEIGYLTSICDGSIDGAIVVSRRRNDFYSENYAVPVTTILIAEALGQDKLKKYCFLMFEKLLAKGA